MWGPECDFHWDDRITNNLQNTFGLLLFFLMLENLNPSQTEGGLCRNNDVQTSKEEGHGAPAVAGRGTLPASLLPSLQVGNLPGPTGNTPRLKKGETLRISTRFDPRVRFFR